MSDAMSNRLPPSVEIWRGEFMEAAARYERRRARWRRRLAGPLLALALIGTGGVAVAEIIDRIDSPELPPYAGETHAYLNLRTGEPIRCPDGRLLTFTPEPGTTEYGEARCADGSVPAVYQRQREELESFAQQTEFGMDAGKGPRFAYELEEPG